jgi:glutamate dehydrogenase
MAVRAGDLESDRNDQLSAAVAARLADEPTAAYREFVRRYYHLVPARDLADRSPDELVGAIVSHWRLARRREPGQAKVSVHNPAGKDGWTSPYTSVDIVSDDMPFIVDSVTMELNRQGYGIELIVHPVMQVVRDSEGELQEVLAPSAPAFGYQAESVIHAEVGRQSDPDRLAVLHSGIELVLEEVRAAVEDWGPMRARTTELATELRRQAPPCEPHDLSEAQAFLTWLADEHFTFLGYREYTLGKGSRQAELRPIPGSGLGILRGASATPAKVLSGRTLAQARLPQPLVLTKANTRATVHRPSYLDYVGVKRYGPDGAVIGERRFLGLYTTTAYKTSPGEIPLLRDKVQYVMAKAGFPDDSHDAKGLVDILESLPRDLLLQIDPADLFEMAIGILGLGERQRVRLFVYADRLDRFVSCTVCMPRDRFNTENRIRTGRVLAEAFGGDQVDWRLQLSESVIVRIDYVIHCPRGVAVDYDVAAIEARIARETRAWADALRAALVAEHGQAVGVQLHARFRAAFPPGYRADGVAATAVGDIALIDRLLRDGRSQGALIDIYRRRGDPERLVRAKLLSLTPVSLSDVVPKFEHLGATVVDERPYEIQPADTEPVWVYDFGLRLDPEGLDRAGEELGRAFLAVWSGELEDDRLNGLVMRAGLTGREVTLVRAVLRYLRQAAVAFSDAYMIETLLENPEVARCTVALFAARFDPDGRDAAAVDGLVAEIRAAIDTVASLDADRILRRVLAVVNAMTRTNYFRRDTAGRPPGYLSFKLDPTRLQFLPRPRPRFEIFVYSPRVEGVHLRGGKVARGGLRWSDRREDFRTEVLGLMKAQMVKNALIVPVGSKGGFVVKRQGGREQSRDANPGRDAVLREGIACYRTFLCGLLDLTDNYVGDQVVGPERVVRYDGDDPYLVVAADKGTATFSDIANEVADGYGYWLGDAFASGGSHGYDHKRMGITARGAWVSVKRHFRELGTDIDREPFTVVAIGDMSGDVFGNGMLRSPHTRLLAAFNHAHVFLDPEPDPVASFAERERLFALPRSGWDDYDRDVISEGGGVYARTSKTIEITPQVRAALGIDADSLAPNELITELLRAPVDLLFNGGIGTYVKAGVESQRDAGDRANDGVRVNGSELRCRVVGEGGNLGLTQRGRIEYTLEGGPSRTGGQINTDAIDNVAGVNCSDHEVNIKILLDQRTATGEMTVGERNALLRQMTDAVGEAVLADSYVQTQAISLALAQAPHMVAVHGRLIADLEQMAALDREIEFLPSDAVLAERAAAGRGLTAPELATILAYGKIHLYEQLLESDLPEDPFLVADLERYFPPPLPESYGRQMRAHRLRRELLATVVANQVVDRAGITYAFRMHEETGATAPQLARAFAVAREVFEMRALWAEVEGLDNQVAAATQTAMLLVARRLVERAARWLIRSTARGEIDVVAAVDRFGPGARELAQTLPAVLSGQDREAFQNRLVELANAGVAPGLARRIACLPALLSVFDIVEDAAATGCSESVVAPVYFGIGARLGLDWLRDRILELPRADRWQALARSALRDDLYQLHRALTRDVLAGGAPGAAAGAIETWLAANPEAVARADAVVADVRAARTYDTTTLPVVLRELKNLVS